MKDIGFIVQYLFEQRVFEAVEDIGFIVQYIFEQRVFELVDELCIAL